MKFAHVRSSHAAGLAQYKSPMVETLLTEVLKYLVSVTVAFWYKQIKANKLGYCDFGTKLSSVKTIGKYAIHFVFC